VELADALEQMWQKQRYHEIFFMVDTCQSQSMFQLFYSPNILAVGSSHVGEDSLSHHVDPAIGVYIIDRYTYYALEFLESVKPDSQHTMAQFLKVSLSCIVAAAAVIFIAPGPALLMFEVFSRTGPPFFKQRYLLTYFIPRENNDIANYFIVRQSESLKFTSKMRQNTFGGRAPPGPAGELKHSPRHPSCND